MVQRLKRLKASTEAFRSPSEPGGNGGSSPRHPRRPGAGRGYLPSPGKRGPRFLHPRTETYILLYRFANETPDRDLAGKIHLLLQESLNQFDEFRVIDEKTAREITAIPDDRPIDIPRLREKYPIRITVDGKLTHIGDKYNIEAHLPFSGREAFATPFFIPGKERNSLLTDQIDNLSRRIYLAAFRDKREEEIKSGIRRRCSVPTGRLSAFFTAGGNSGTGRNSPRRRNFSCKPNACRRRCPPPSTTSPCFSITRAPRPNR